MMAVLLLDLVLLSVVGGSHDLVHLAITREGV